MSVELTLVQSRFAAVRRKIRVLFLVDYLWRLMFLAGLFVPVTFVLDYFFILPSQVRLVFLGVGVAYGLYLTYRRLALPMFVNISDDDLALFVERHYPHLNSRLISALQLSRDGGGDPEFNSPELVQALVTEVRDVVEQIRFDSILEPGTVLKPLAAASALVAALGVMAIIFPEYSTVYLKRVVGMNAKWPRLTDLHVLGVTGNKIPIARGDDVMVLVQATGTPASKVYVNYEFGKEESGKKAMTGLPKDQFDCKFDRVTAPFRFYISTRDVETEWYYVEVLNPPEVKDLRIFLKHPKYLQSEDTPKDHPILDANLKVPMFTEVILHAECEDNLTQAAVLVGSKSKQDKKEARLIQDEHGQKKAFEASFVVDSDAMEYSLLIRSVNGLWNRDPQKFQVKGVKDEPPVIEVREPRFGLEEVTKECKRPLTLIVRDDHAIKEIYMKQMIKGSVNVDWARVDFPPDKMTGSPGDKKIVVDTLLIFEKLMDLREDDEIDVQFFAEDYNDIGEKVAGFTKVFGFKIVSVAKLEKALESEIEGIKNNLRGYISKETVLIMRTDRMKAKLAANPEMTSDARGELREASIEQSDLTEKLGLAVKQIDYIRLRGIWNLIFDDKSARALQEAEDMLLRVCGTTAESSGASWVAAHKLMDVAKVQSQKDRAEALDNARALQYETRSAIDAALIKLDNWASFQEAVRLVREAYELQQDAKKKYEERLRCPDCRNGNCPKHR